MTPTLNDGSRCWVKAKFFDKAGLPQIPSAMQYRLDCETTGENIIGWTPFAPTDTSVEIFIDAPFNNIIRSQNPIERKVLTVQANSDDPANVFNDTQEWDVVNLLALD